MKRIMDAILTKDFAVRTYDPNEFHDDVRMWEKYGIPGAVAGMQLLMSSLSTADREQLMGVNYGQVHFPRAVIIGNEVDFQTKVVKGGPKDGKDAGHLRLEAAVNGEDVLTVDKNTYSAASRVGLSDRPNFYEGEQSFQMRISADDLAAFQALTGLPEDAVPILYAVSLSSSSINSRIQSPTSPSWRALRDDLYPKEEDKAKIPTYESLEFYLPGGMRRFDLDQPLTLHSCISLKASTYVIDTLCYDSGRTLYGIRSNLKQRRKAALIKGIEAMIDGLNPEKAGSLAGAIEKRREIKARASSSQPST